MHNKLVLVTGANSGIGKYTALELVRRGAYVIMLCRNEEKAKRAKGEIVEKTGRSGIEIIVADLAIQQDIRRAADEYLHRFNALDVLINNAGIVASKRRETADGIERTFAINHLGPFLLTNLLEKALQRAPSARIITVSSQVHRVGAAVFDINNLQLETGYSPYKAYGISKLCNIMFTHELAKRTNSENITANCLHPGVVGTRIADEASWWLKFVYFAGKPFMRSLQKGAQTGLYLATSDKVGRLSGKYFKDGKIANPASIAFDDELTEAVWEKSAALTGLN